MNVPTMRMATPDVDQYSILVSFVNQPAAGRPLLGLLEPATGRFRVLSLPEALQPCCGIAGLTTASETIIAAVQDLPSPTAGPARTPGLLIFDQATLALQAQHALPDMVDIHGVCTRGEMVYVVSTGTDEVFELRRAEHEIDGVRCIWRPDRAATRADHHHLNTISWWHNSLLVSGFGRKLGLLWSSATDGFIVDIMHGRTLVSGIRHPHSLIELGDDLAYCESRSLSVRTIKGRQTAALSGYTRGLCLAGPKLYVGMSRGRRTSKSTGLINNPADLGAPAGACVICRLDAATLAVEEQYRLDAYGDEIFDLLAVPAAGSARWR